jgi:predicted dehydrogenase
LVGIADPAPEAEELARNVGVPWFANYGQMIEVAGPRGAMVATPNVTHARIAMDCMTRGLPVIVEKPIAHTIEDAQLICDVSRNNGVAALVGHHRRYNPIARRAKEVIASGKLGRPVAATVLSTWRKPDAYFDVVWRRQRGGGPILINLIHDIDLKHFPRQDADAYFLSGTEASITLPRLEIWEYRRGRGWHDSLTVERTALHKACPYAEQWRHFRALVEGREPPRCAALDGLRTLEATLAVHTAAQAERPVRMSN